MFHKEALFLQVCLVPSHCSPPAPLPAVFSETGLQPSVTREQVLGSRDISLGGEPWRLWVTLGSSSQPRHPCTGPSCTELAGSEVLNKHVLTSGTFCSLHGCMGKLIPRLMSKTAAGSPGLGGSVGRVLNWEPGCHGLASAPLLAAGGRGTLSTARQSWSL